MYLEHQNSDNIRNSFKRIEDYSNFVKKFGKQIVVSEDWELIKVNLDDSNPRRTNLENNIYVLLHSVATTELFREDELKVTVIPLNLSSYERCRHKVWSVKISLTQGEVKFANFMPFEILPESLRGKGLGSYILSKLIRRVEQYPPEFSVQLHAQSIDNSSPGNEKRVNALYQKFNLLDAESIFDINHPVLSKIESLPLDKFCSDFIRENTILKYDEQRKHKEIDDLRERCFHQQKRIKFLIGVLILLIAIIFWLFQR